MCFRNRYCLKYFSTRPSQLFGITLYASKKKSLIHDRNPSASLLVGKVSIIETIELCSSTKSQRYIFTSSTNTENRSNGDASKNVFDDFRAREEEKEFAFIKQQQHESREEESTKAEKLIRTKILEASLQFVAAHGWTKKSLALGAEAVDYPSVAHGLFPDGGIELIRYFYGKCNDELLDYLKKKTNNGEQKVDNPVEFVIDATKVRLQMLEPYIAYWPQAVAIMSLPQNVPTSLAQMLTLVDDICYYCGDRSVDFKWYIRRIGLATIYKMTEVFMLQDLSIDHQETWRFLRNRMEEASFVQDFFNQSEGLTQNMQKGVASAFTTARNILGIDYGKR